MSASSEAQRGSAERVGRSLAPLIGLLLVVLVPAGLYAFYLLGQLSDIRDHHLRRLDRAAESIASLIANARTTIESLSEDSAYACVFFQRQVRLELVRPACTALQDVAIDPDALELAIDDSRRLEFVQRRATTELQIRVRLDVIIDQIPFGDAFDQLLIVDQQGTLLGPAISPRRRSPMEPPGVDVPVSAPPLRIIDLSHLTFAGESEDATVDFASLEHTTFVRRVTLAGAGYDLMCQPLRIALRRTGAAETWRLCGLVDSRRSFRQALEVAPHVVIGLLVFLTLAVVSWPLLKVLSLAPRERVRFADLYLTLIATLALVMLIAVGVADLGTYWTLRDRSSKRLEALARDVDARLRNELLRMRDQLLVYDQQLAGHPGTEALLDLARTGAAASVGCLHLDEEDREAGGRSCQRPDRSPVPVLPPPTAYTPIESVFWMRPCDGRQFLKASTMGRNTPAVTLERRAYFQAVKQDRLWPDPAPAREGDAPGPLRFSVETSSSITTGAFFAAISMRSGLNVSGQPLFPRDPAGRGAVPASWRDCEPPEDARFGVALTAQPVSVRYPVLGPGVGFAVVDTTGRVVFHTDERRAVYDNLLADEGLADRLRAAFASGAETGFYASYETRPHQVHVRPMSGLPWFVVTFADDEILRTLHVELLARAGVLITAYLLLALLGTLLYMLVHGREPPPWVWPRLQPEYREVYAWTIWSLAAQGLVFLLALDALRGWTLVAGAVLLPLPALAVVVLAARQAQRMDAARRAGDGAGVRQLAVLRQRRVSALALGAAAAIALALHTTMRIDDPASALQSQTGGGTLVLAALLAMAVAAPRLARRRGHDAGPHPRRLRPWGDAATPHVAATVLVWLLVGALPAYGLYKFALADEMTVLARMEQAYLARVIGWRGCHIQDDFRMIPTPPGSAMRAARLALPQPGQVQTDVYPSALLSRAVAFGPPDRPPLPDRLQGPLGRLASAPLERFAPIYNETTTYARYLEPLGRAGRAGGGGESRWSWQRTAEHEAVLVYHHDQVTACDALVPARLAAQPALAEPQFAWLGWAGLVGAGLLLVGWSAYGVRRIFFGDIEADARPAVLTRALSLDRDLSRLGRSPDLAWAEAEVAPLADAARGIPIETLRRWCETCSTRRAVVDCLLEQVRDYYEALWADASEEERLVLVQLVEEGMANPKQPEVVRGLLKRGLIRRDPVLRPMNHSFALFVDQRVDREQIRVWEQPLEGARWSRVRGGLVVVLIAVLLFLSFTQRDAVEVWIAYLGTFAAGAAGVMRLLSLLSRPAVQRPE